MHALMHGPTFMGNAMGCAAANASLDLFEMEPRLEQARAVGATLAERLDPCRGLPGVADVRCLGAIGVVELAHGVAMEGLRDRFVAQGCWVRPFNRVLYLAPALNIPESDLARLCDVMHEIVAHL